MPLPDKESAEPKLLHALEVEDVYSVAWSPDGSKLSSGGRDGMLRVWDTTRGKEIHVLQVQEPKGGLFSGVFSVAWSPDGSKLASGSEESIMIWSIPK